MNEARNDADNCAAAQKRAELLLRAANQQYSRKTASDQAIERPIIARDMAAFEQSLA